MHYTAANGKAVWDEVPSDTKGKNVRQLKLQICDVNNALGSVMKIVKNVNKAVFDESGSFIENKETGGRKWLKEHDGWVRAGMLCGSFGRSRTCF